MTPLSPVQTVVTGRLLSNQELDFFKVVDKSERMDGLRNQVKLKPLFLTTAKDFFDTGLPQKSRIFDAGHIFRIAIASSTPFILGIRTSERR